MPSRTPSQGTRSPAARTSAGLVPFHIDETGCLQVFIAHMGGPYWAGKDTGAWSIIKGEFDPEHEEPRRVARREFEEEVGCGCPQGDWLDLGTVRQRSGKRVTAFAVEADPALCFVTSNEFELEWPPRSGQRRRFPEVDRAQWWPVDVAVTKLVDGQVPIIETLCDLLRDERG